MSLAPLSLPSRLPSARACRTAATGALVAALGIGARADAQPFLPGPADPAAPGSTARPVVVPAAPAPFTVRVVGRGRPVVLIPGLMSGPDVWDATVAHLGGRYALHVVHLAGFAGAPAAPGPDFLGRVRDGLLAYVGDLRARGAERPVVVGHSLGGFLAYAMASAAPDALAGVVAVDGVPFLAALADSTATPAAVRPRAEAIRALFAALTPEQLAAQTRPGLPMLMRDTSHVGRAVAWARASDPATVGQAMAELMTTDLRPQGAAIRVPVLQVAAGGGATTPAARAALRDRYAAQGARVPRHEVVVAERAYHFVMLDDPAFFHAALDAFLAPLARAGAAPAAGGVR